MGTTIHLTCCPKPRPQLTEHYLKRIRCICSGRNVCPNIVRGSWNFVFGVATIRLIVNSLV